MANSMPGFFLQLGGLGVQVLQPGDAEVETTHISSPFAERRDSVRVHPGFWHAHVVLPRSGAVQLWILIHMTRKLSQRVHQHCHAVSLVGYQSAPGSALCTVKGPVPVCGLA